MKSHDPNNRLVDHLKHHELENENTLHVVTMISNPVRYNSRYQLYREYAKAMAATPNVKLYTVEVAFGDRKFEVTERGNPKHLQLRVNQELWHKENALNLGVRHLLPIRWKYLAWVDGDVFFRDPNWAQETMQQLQHYEVIQPWRSCSDLGFHGHSMQQFEGFGYLSNTTDLNATSGGYYGKRPFAHSGFAWACTRYFWENVEGLIDFAILGSADHHMAWAILNKVTNSIHPKAGKAYRERCFAWQKRAFRVTHGRIGFVNTHIEHRFHGAKVNRKYRERWQILLGNAFDPNEDLMRDRQGLYLTVSKPQLQKEIMTYMRQRNEDSIEE